MHRKGGFGNIETWYYDAIFDNDCSVVTLVNVIHLGPLSQVLTGLFIYKNNKLIKNVREKIPYRHFHGSEKTPYLAINGKSILKENIEADSQKLITHVTMGDDIWGVDLKFTKTAVPFKGKTLLGKWLVIPRFSVEGSLNCDGKTIDVFGEGYHDHNMYPVYAPFVTKGYHFGKIPFDSMNITWANIIKRGEKRQPIIVFNKKNEYVSIDPSEIQFIIEKEIEEHKKTVPTVWRIVVDNEKLQVDVKLKSIHHHYVSIPSVHYWRHHTKNSGSIAVDSHKIKIDSYEISEYLKFF